jgi:hypothetical protein
MNHNLLPGTFQHWLIGGTDMARIDVANTLLSHPDFEFNQGRTLPEIRFAVERAKARQAEREGEAKEKGWPVPEAHPWGDFLSTAERYWYQYLQEVQPEAIKMFEALDKRSKAWIADSKSTDDFDFYYSVTLDDVAAIAAVKTPEEFEELETGILADLEE